MRKKSVVEGIVDYIIQDVINGNLQPGDRIPTEVELQERLGVGRNSVREAVKKLEASGVVHIRRADGTYICENYTQKMLDPILYDIILQKNSWKDFVEMRKVVETGILHIVVGKPGLPRELNDMGHEVDKIEAEFAMHQPRVSVIMDCDTRFHDLITQSTGNPQLATITDYVTRITIPSRTQTVIKVLADGNGEHFVALHRQILDILRYKRVGDIDQAVIDHYIYWK